MADIITFPLDTAKVRLQVSNASVLNPVTLLVKAEFDISTAVHAKPAGMLRTLSTICIKEGPRAMYSGLVAGLQRQMCFSSIRVGFYDDVKRHYQKTFSSSNQTSPSVFIRILSGLTTGAMCVTIAQPTDVVKIRMQASGAGVMGGTKVYQSVLGAYMDIARTEGLRGLWRGYLPNVTRNCITNVSELVTYDIVKEHIIHRELMTDNIYCHMVCGLVAGFVATVIASPVDVVKTRYISAPVGRYSGVINCLSTMIRDNGIGSIYKGFVPSFIRFGTWNIIMFVCYEQLKRRFADLGLT